MRETIAHADLLNRIRYNGKTGQFFSRKTGQRLGYIKNEKGARSIDICGKKYQETRLAVFYTHGKWPIGNVKHTSRSNRVTKLKDLVYDIHKTETFKNIPTVLVGQNMSMFCRFKKWLAS
jgi:hypothetical protein